MHTYIKPQKYLIFSSEQIEKRVYWNHEILVGSFLYRMIGVIKYSPGHFFSEFFDPTSMQWIHINSLAESRKDTGKGYTLKILRKKKRSVQSIEGLIPRASSVHYVRIL